MDTDSQQAVQRGLIPIRIQVIGLLVGLLSCTLASVMVVNIVGVMSIELPFLGIGAVGLFVMMLFAIFPLLQSLDRVARKRIDPKSENMQLWLGHFGVRTLMACAMIEAPAFLGVVAYLTAGDLLGLVVAGFAAAVMLVFFPTADKITAFIERQRELAANEWMN